MSRPKRRCRGGRVTPKGTRPARRRGELPCGCPTAEELLLRSASTATASDANLDEAEVWAASIQPLFHPGGLACGHALSPSKVLAAAEDCDDTAAAAAVSAAVATYGPRGHRTRARRLLRRLFGEGAPMPPWADELGRVTPLRAVTLVDPWGDHFIVWTDFERPDGEARGIGVEVAATASGPKADLLYGPPIEQFAERAQAGPHTVMTEIGLSDSRATVEAALKMEDRRVGNDSPQGTVIVVNELRALVDHRVALLPEGGSPQHVRALSSRELDDLRRDFLAVASVQHGDASEKVVADIFRFSSAWSYGDPLCWSPCRVTLYLAGWVPANAVGDDGYRRTVELVFPRWLRFAGERCGLSEDLIQVSLETARGALEGTGTTGVERYGDTLAPPATSTLTALLADGVDYHDQDAVHEWLQDYYSHFGHERC